MSEAKEPASGKPGSDMAESARKERERQDRWRREGQPSMMRLVGQIGVLGWIIVTPSLLGLFLGRWIDERLGTGVFWSAPMLFGGLAAGCWSAWRWMHRQ